MGMHCAKVVFGIDVHTFAYVCVCVPLVVIILLLFEHCSIKTFGLKIKNSVPLWVKF